MPAVEGISTADRLALLRDVSDVGDETNDVGVALMCSSWPYDPDDPDQQDRADKAANQVADPSPRTIPK